ncbi:MAG TPA: hypothetical protein VD860_15800 [Azospirillum sp.]|nr:hypothetical protein [Azospirillum sp.]
MTAEIYSFPIARCRLPRAASSTPHDVLGMVAVFVEDMRTIGTASLRQANAVAAGLEALAQGMGINSACVKQHQEFRVRCQAAFDTDDLAELVRRRDALAAEFAALAAPPVAGATSGRDEETRLPPSARREPERETEGQLELVAEKRSDGAENDNSGRHQECAVPT